VSTPEDAIRAVLAESGPDYDSFSAEALAGGTRSDVYVVTLEYGGNSSEVVVKFAPGSADSFAVEPFLQEYVGERTALPVPGILVFEADPAGDVPPYFVTERVRGRNLDDAFADLSATDRERVMEQVGALLGDLHSTIGFEGYGRLDRVADRLVVSDLATDWREYFGTLTRERIDGLAGTVFEDRRAVARECLDAGIGAVPRQGVPRLVHDDFRPGNLVVAVDDRPEITAVLDWERPLAGDPLYNLAQVEFLFVDSVVRDPDARGRLREDLHAGYRRERTIEPDAAFDACKPLYQLSTLVWRMAGFPSRYGEASGLARSRAEAYYRRQFDRLAAAIRAEN